MNSLNCLLWASLWVTPNPASYISGVAVNSDAKLVGYILPIKEDRGSLVIGAAVHSDAGLLGKIVDKK